jgi:hypothetical protein
LRCRATRTRIGWKPDDNFFLNQARAKPVAFNHESTLMNTNSENDSPNYSCEFVSIRG